MIYIHAGGIKDYYLSILFYILGLYSDQTRGVYLLCLLLGAIQPLGWRLVSSADISSKNLDSNERGYSLVSRTNIIYLDMNMYSVFAKIRVSF